MSKDEVMQEFKKGQAALLKEVPDLEVAEAHLRRAVDLDPNAADPRGWLAAALAQGGKFPEALAEMKKAVELAPEDPRHHIALGSVHLHSGQWEEAVEALANGIEMGLEYGEAEARVYLAQAFEYCGKAGSAIEQWRWVASIDDSYPNSEQLKGTANHRLSKLEKES
jgi:tetratricopeptide (TPR) repeat protein